MPSKVALAPRSRFLSTLVRQVRIVVTFAAATFASYCSVTNLAPNAAQHATKAAMHSERAVP